MIITFGNFKGGVGKTTATQLFTFLLSTFDNKKVLAVDTDPQSNLTDSLALTFQKELDVEKNIFNACFSSDPLRDFIQPIHENVDILAGSWDMEFFGKTASKMYKSSFLHEILTDKFSEVKNEYDYILVDTSPSTGIVMENAIYATDYVVIPTKTEPMAYDSTTKFYQYLLSLDDDTDFHLVGVMPYLVGDSSTDRKMLERYKEVFDEILFENTIRASDRVKTWSNKGITTDKPYDKQTLEMYYQTVIEAIKRIESAGALT